MGPQRLVLQDRQHRHSPAHLTSGPACSSPSLQVAAGTVLSSPPRLKAVPRWFHRPPSVVSFYLASLINVSYVNSILTTTLQGGEYYSQFTGGETEVQRW